MDTPRAATRTVSDCELWAQARGGNAEAFGEIYARHARAVHVLRADSAAALLFGIANNVVRGHWRTSRRYGEALVRLRAAVPTVGAGPESAVIARVDASRQVREASEALRALPPHEREVLALIADDDLSYEEAASALGVPIGTCARAWPEPAAAYAAPASDWKKTAMERKPT